MGKRPGIWIASADAAGFLPARRASISGRSLPECRLQSAFRARARTFPEGTSPLRRGVRFPSVLSVLSVSAGRNARWGCGSSQTRTQVAPGGATLGYPILPRLGQRTTAGLARTGIWQWERGALPLWILLRERVDMVLLQGIGGRDQGIARPRRPTQAEAHVRGQRRLPPWPAALAGFAPVWGNASRAGTYGVVHSCRSSAILAKSAGFRTKLRMPSALASSGVMPSV